MKLLGFAPVFAAACGACSSPSNTVPDAKKTPDAAVDAAACPADRFFTGQYVDWDSSDTGSFCGIMGATFEVHGDPAISHVTPPNGRFQLCLASATATQVDIAVPAAASPCTMPSSTYTLPGTTIADPAVIASGQLVSMANFTASREESLGVMLETANAFVFVHVDGTQAPVSITASSAAAQAHNGTTWGTGTTGSDVFFPNVDPSAGSTTVAMTGAIAGAGSVPLVAGTITYVTLVAN
ncbi:MAG TPA: hypothetical protein VGF94_28205 [Kofleriaceae bacterium]